MARLWPVSLRGRLMAGVILLAALGMLAVNTASLLALRIYFTAVADANLARIRDTIQRTTTPATLASLAAGNTYYLTLLDAQGHVLTDLPIRGLDGQLIPPPDLPVPVPDGFAATATAIPTRGTPATTYRLLAFPVAPGVAVESATGKPIDRVIIGEDVGPSQKVLYWLIGVEAVATLAALGTVALLSRGVLAVGLRPLRTMAATATAIAAGEADQRIPVTRRHTEIDEVGDALNQAFDVRRESEDRLRQFVADASHELRTPLTAIRGWAQLHLHGLAREPEMTDRAMARIEAEAGRMHTMVDELLLLARLDQGRAPATTPVELSRLATDAAADFSAVEPDRPITLDAQEGVFADGDEDRLLQVLHNLLNNARQHTPAGTPVSLAVRALPGDRVELTVTDQGPGMDQDTAARIFERFYRGDSSRNLDTGGTGLGLSIVKSIVDAYEGTVVVRTRLGEGSTFTVTLPAAS